MLYVTFPYPSAGQFDTFLSLCFIELFYMGKKEETDIVIDPTEGPEEKNHMSSWLIREKEDV